MVYLHFPSNLTDEELMLQAKYQQLRKKRKAVTDMKCPKIEPEKRNPLKKPLDPKDAKELAKTLIRSGRVSLPVKCPNEKSVFKRSRTLQRKISETGRPDGGMTPYPHQSSAMIDPPYGYEPFTPQKEEMPMSSSPSKFMSASSSSPVRTMKSFRDKNSEREESRNHGSEGSSGSRPKRGPTIYVHAAHINEETLTSAFASFGKIVNTKMESANTGFITFDRVETAETAITEMNGNTVDDRTFDVQFARRQPAIPHVINDATASASWSAVALSQSHKGVHHDKRAAVVYDEQ